MKLKSGMKYNEGGIRKYDYEQQKTNVFATNKKKHILI